MTNFWLMGGYARFVWPCYALALLVLVWNAWAARRRLTLSRRRALRAAAISMSDSV